MCLARPEPIEPSPLIPAKPQGSTTRLRHKLWELETKLHCPVIGTCLTNAELRTLAKKHGDRYAAGKNDYWLHTFFVTNTQGKNKLSLATYKYLERKYSSAVRQFAQAKDAATLRLMWEDFLARGATAEALWATTTHGQCTDELKEEAFETIHMLSHQIGAGQQADLKRLTQAEAELVGLKQEQAKQIKKTNQQLHDKDKQLQQLRDELEAQQLRNRQLEITNEQHQLTPADDTSNEQLQQQNQQLEQRFQDSQAALQRATEQRDHWHMTALTYQRKLDKIKAQHDQDVRTLEAAFGPVASASGCSSCGSSDCSACPDLAGQNVLCVGGLHRLVDQYRAIIERSNGNFSHHDGGKEDSRKRLESMLAAADTVICAVDCVSHDAYYKLKRFCKQHGKRHIFMESSSLSSFAQTVGKLSSQLEQTDVA
ncbi:DUF2325 domain-containing protein [Ferrimonas lipolytica]|uniref:DUF2325 domain-containing protein n=1 Tax=Ferrimonas lipolytica TaxID=2724191 RepID=A0A6H1UB07_9GAMM|nr:DUF2325 domain-containing protein [Ferrimonas lipolytica]QIZ75819.1 DUF2325 domain-containing protein [Ferrimonas lipolytica]